MLPRRVFFTGLQRLWRKNIQQLGLSAHYARLSAISSQDLIGIGTKEIPVVHNIWRVERIYHWSCGEDGAKLQETEDQLSALTKIPDGATSLQPNLFLLAKVWIFLKFGNVTMNCEKKNVDHRFSTCWKNCMEIKFLYLCYTYSLWKYMLKLSNEWEVYQYLLLDVEEEHPLTSIYQLHWSRVLVHLDT